jgi:hypothetical protein
MTTVVLWGYGLGACLYCLRDFIQLKGGFNAKEISFENVDGGNPHNDRLRFTGRNFLTAGRRRGYKGLHKPNPS